MKGCIIYANTHSLFENTSGANNSLYAILRTAAQWGLETHAIHGTCTYSKDMHRKILEQWQQLPPGKTNPLVRNKKEKGVYHTLIKTQSSKRVDLTCIEQEVLYRCANAIIRSCADRYQNPLFISWGNLLLENSLVRLSNNVGVKTIFYLANPGYQKHYSEALAESQYIITDSIATKNMYASQCKQTIEVMPKLYETVEGKIPAATRYQQKRITLVNGRVEKGLEVFILLAAHFSKTNNNEYRFTVIDSHHTLGIELQKLGIDQNSLPANVEIRGPQPSTNELLSDTTILMLLSLWHESGSRLIHESHQRGIPVLCFSTGGSQELCSSFPRDLFAPPSLDSNLRVKRIDLNPLINRVFDLLKTPDVYSEYADLLTRSAQAKEQNNIEEFQKKLYAMITS